tara:strand:- start:403 stop:858 length:456 start_codon:yes stop_codon:yes gene_type:complete
MIITRKIFFFILLFSLGSCGYQPMYLKKNDLNNVIQSFQAEGDKKINRKIISSLNLKSENKTAGYKLIINSNKTLETVSKEKTGNSSVYKTQVTVKISLLDDDKIFKEKTFNSQFTYNNIKNKFNLSQYQKDIEINLVNEIIEEIFIFLTT